MKNILIYYFTGTGNTRIAAKAIKSELERLKYHVTLYEIRVGQKQLPDPNDYDMIGFGYPIHAFNAPKFYLKQIKQLPKVNHKKAFIFKTSGEPFGFNKVSSWTLYHLLKRQGYILQMERHLLMPYNIMFRYKDQLAKQMYQHTLSMSKVIAYDIHMNKSKKIHFNWLLLPIMYLFRIQWFGAKINGPLFYAIKDLCISCSQCASVCPTNNIIMKDGIPTFGGDCTMCMACVMHCPTDAIRPGIVSKWRVNGTYPFESLAHDDLISADFIHEGTKGYFKLFKKYYEKTNEEIKSIQELDDKRA